MPVTKKTNRAEAADGRFQPGQSGNPAGRPLAQARLHRMAAEFGQEHAELLLGAALKHAIESPAACLELTRRVFGDNWQLPDPRHLVGSLDSLDDCALAEHRARHERAYGRLSDGKFREVIATIEARREVLAAAAEPPAHDAPKLEPRD